MNKLCFLFVVFLAVACNNNPMAPSDDYGSRYCRDQWGAIHTPLQSALDTYETTHTRFNNGHATQHDVNVALADYNRLHANYEWVATVCPHPMTQIE